MSCIIRNIIVHGEGAQEKQRMAPSGLCPRLEPWPIMRHEHLCQQHWKQGPHNTQFPQGHGCDFERSCHSKQAGKDCRLKKVPLKVGAQWIVVDIVCPLLFVINDGKQGNQLCCRTNGHHRSQQESASEDILSQSACRPPTLADPDDASSLL
jgi:hypothetical protein